MTPHEKRVSIFETKEQYLQMKQKWAERKTHSALEHALYNILRGYHAQKGFSPIVRESRIKNGHQGAFYDLVHYQLVGMKLPWAKERMEKKLNNLFGDLITFPTLVKAYEFLDEFLRDGPKETVALVVGHAIESNAPQGASHG